MGNNTSASNEAQNTVVVTSTNAPTESQIIEEETNLFIQSGIHDLYNARACVRDLLDQLKKAIECENTLRDADNKLKLHTEIPLLSIAMLIVARDDVSLVATGTKGGANQKIRLAVDKRMKLPIGIYQWSGDNEGVWEVTNSPTESFGLLVEQYKPTATKKEKTEIFTFVKGRLNVITPCQIPYYTAFENGIWDCLNKQLLPFSKDLVFTAKCHTRLNQNAVNPFIQIPEDGSTWDVDSWLADLGTPDFVTLIKEVIQASMLPLAPRDKMVLFYSSSGCNSKGTLCQLIRNILGEETVASIPLSEFSKTFGLSRLPGSNAIIVDENCVSDFTKGLAELKAVITGDVVSINEKYVPTYDYRFQGLVLQCVNDMPNGNDKSGSFYRRLHIIPFTKSFTGNPKKYIKDRLIYDEQVLEYIVKMVMVDMPYSDTFTENSISLQALADYIQTTNSVVQYLMEILPEVKWDLLPASEFLYDGYKNWLRNVSPSARVCGRTDFYESVKQYITTDPIASVEWEWTASCRSKGRIDCSVKEPLIVELGLDSFINQTINVGNPLREYPDARRIKLKYSGLKRRPTSGTASAVSNSTASDTDDSDD